MLSNMSSGRRTAMWLHACKVMALNTVELHKCNHIAMLHRRMPLPMLPVTTAVLVTCHICAAAASKSAAICCTSIQAR